jgi:hypothetical protein
MDVTCPHTKSYDAHKDKSAASFFRWVAAWFSVMFCNFYLVKNHKIVNNSKFTKARENICTYLESLNFRGEN